MCAVAIPLIINALRDCFVGRYLLAMTKNRISCKGRSILWSKRLASMFLVRPLKKSKILAAVKFGENFRKNTKDQSQNIDNDWLFSAMTRPFYLHKQPDLSRISGFSVHWTHASLGYAVFSILEARKRLKAICLKSASSAFLIILGNLARFALLYKWLNPKYCSTIYRSFEIALFLSFSYSVSSVPAVALRMMPSSILFKERNSLFGFPKYPLSANTFLMGSSV